MRPYQVIGLLVVAAGVSFVVGLRVGEKRGAQAATAPTGGCDTCALPAGKPGAQAKAPAIPTGSGRSCLVEFGSDECSECKKMVAVLSEVEAKLNGKVDVVRVDTDVHPGEAQRWRLRIVPTQILADSAGKELWRHEGYITAAELLRQAGEAGHTGK